MMARGIDDAKQILDQIQAKSPELIPRDSQNPLRVVKNAIRGVWELWAERRSAAIDQHVDRELARLAEIERELWRCWHESAGESETVTESETIDQNGEPRTLITRVKRVLTNDSKYMKLLLETIEKRARLLGLYKEDRGPVEGKGPRIVVPIVVSSHQEVLDFQSFMSKALVKSDDEPAQVEPAPEDGVTDVDFPDANQ